MKQKNTEISERIIRIIDFVGVSNNEFAKKLGYDRSQSIYDIVNGKSKPSFDFFQKLLNSEYSEIINFENLILGQGEILKTKSVEKVIKKNDNLNDNFFDTKLNVQKKLSNENSVVTEPQAVYSNNTREDYKKRGIPKIPIEAMAGFGTGSVQVMDYETGRYVIPEFEEINVDFIIPVKGSSMYPKYSSGDLVACKKLAISDIFFQWNKVYVLDTEQGAIIKRIKKSNEAESISLVSENPKYDPFDLHLSQVYAIALVVGVIRLE